MHIRGLRALAPLVRTCALVVPHTCDVYLDSTLNRHWCAFNTDAPDALELHTRYLLAPAPPLITDPDAARALAAPALARNLAAHAAHNAAVRAR